MHRSFGGVSFLLLLMTSTILFPPYWVYVDLMTMPCCFQSPWQWGYSIFTPLCMRFSAGVFKGYLRGGGCVGTLWSLENFWGVWEKNPFFLRGKRKKRVFLKGGLQCYFWSFFLGGKRQFTLSSLGGEGVAIKWNGSWCWGFKTPILRLLWFFLLFFFIQPTDLKSANAFDAKRPQGGRPYY